MLRKTTIAKGLKDTLSCPAMPDPSDKKQDTAACLLGRRLYLRDLLYKKISLETFMKKFYSNINHFLSKSH